MAARTEQPALRRSKNVLDNISTRFTKNSSQDDANAQNHSNLQVNSTIFAEYRFSSHRHHFAFLAG
ncbi:hypothetical protein Agau_L101936 [Agrobacterium tumefaciens F2]|nr:hypothetical protein Agau_L101936 [Agrobacterium tumefaciens F2]